MEKKKIQTMYASQLPITNRLIQKLRLTKERKQIEIKYLRVTKRKFVKLNPKTKNFKIG